MGQFVPDAEWAEELSQYLEDLVDMRINHVRAWVRSNLTRFQASQASILELQRVVESAIIDLKSSVQLCRMQGSACQLLCIQNRLHDGPRDCQTKHRCTQTCEFCAELEIPEEQEAKKCLMGAGHFGKHVCSVNVNLCGVPCKLLGKSGCLEECSKMMTTNAPRSPMPAESRVTFPMQLLQTVRSTRSRGDARFRLILSTTVTTVMHGTVRYFVICKRLCSSHNHLHALEADAVHLCGQEHPCPQRCTAPGVCEIDTPPHSIEATFEGMHECFHYTRYMDVVLASR
ncbi:hypothetical protein PAXRUDRAFT_407542 [Paxillus rubicundulus Ve08.2h10]|uniref:Uncharacterized protein n=1 Tax=Paxillus rubicundulus Ve08.2h10 TaxID=930991 RepID=A0A0D0CNT0_9AGAM|nr:hypothetical protein PAXRUDRAFT_407542 [Paxillus rubicundulus Ve08.2h10]